MLRQDCQNSIGQDCWSTSIREGYILPCLIKIAGALAHVRATFCHAGAGLPEFHKLSVLKCVMTSSSPQGTVERQTCGAFICDKHVMDTSVTNM